MPTLFLVDPWGYKGLSSQLVIAVLKDWGCNCTFFFNYNRINIGLANPMVQEHMVALFGEDCAQPLREKRAGRSPEDRESCIVEELCAAFGAKLAGAKQERYVLPFRFKNGAGTRTGHHLFFVSKHPLGYSIMKEITAAESSLHEQGVSSFHYSPAGIRFPLHSELKRPLDTCRASFARTNLDSTRFQRPIAPNACFPCSPAGRLWGSPRAMVRAAASARLAKLLGAGAFLGAISTRSFCRRSRRVSATMSCFLASRSIGSAAAERKTSTGASS